MSATETIKKVLANVVQHFTESEKAQARSNIGAAAATDVVTDAVKYSPQTLTVPQQNQARQNINAAENIIASSSNNGLMSSSDKSKLDGIQSGAEANVQSDWNQTNNLADDFIKNKPENLVQDADYVHTDNNFTTEEKTKLAGIEAGAEVNVQSDWSQTDNSKDDYIKNKPANLVQDADYVHTDNNFTTSEKNKLSGIEANAEVNVQSDWNQTDNTKDDFIKNKPANLVQDASYVHTDNNFTTTLKNKLDGIAAGAEVNVQSDWNQTNTSSDDYIKNKPSNLVQDASYVHTDNNFTTTLKNKLDGIASGAEVNVQADWNQTDSTKDDYIKNKPVPVTDVTVDGTSVVSNGVAAITKDAEILVYGSTGAWAKLTAAIAANKVVVCRVNTSGSNYREVVLSYYNVSTGTAEFNFHRANPTKDYTTQNDELYVYGLSSNGTWTTTQINVAMKYQAGNGLDKTVTNNDNITFLVKPKTNGGITVDSNGVALDSSLKTKLDGIQSGAEVNVQPDWNQTDSSADDYIKNKPTVVGQVNSNWTASSGVAQILNKPEIGYKGYGDTAVTEATSLVIDGDEPTGITDVKVNNSSKGTLISGPYKTLLDSGLDGLGDSSEGVFIDSDGTFKKCTKNVVYVGLDTPYADVLAHVNANREVILRVWPTVDNPLFQDFRLMQYNPDGSMEFSCVTSGYGTIFTYKYMLFSNGVWQRTNTSATTYQGILIEGIGRNLHLNQNNQVQTNLPGGVFTAPTSAGNSFERLTGANFAGAYMLACRHNTSETYEIAIVYTASGMTSSYTFLGTETVIGTDNSVTTKQAVYSGTAYYTPTSRFGGTQATAFDPNNHKAIIYNGIGLIGPCSDCKIVIYNDNGTVKLAFTAIEVGKVGATN